MTKILFLDCDGTIRQPKSGSKFISSPLDQEIIPGADIAIDYHHKLGHIIIGITNQGGVAAGHKSLEDAIKEQQYTLELFPHIESIIFCPDFEGNIALIVTRVSVTQYKNKNDFDSSFRKPGKGMIDLAVNDLLERQNTLIKGQDCQMVGDRDEDKACAAAAGISFTPADLWRNCYLALEKEYNETGGIA